MDYLLLFSFYVECVGSDFLIFGEYLFGYNLEYLFIVVVCYFMKCM